MEAINLKDYVIVERKPCFNLSVKLVVPGGCAMRCPFCFNKLNRTTAVHAPEDFLSRWLESVVRVVADARSFSAGRPVSLDITGNEPTFSLALLSEIADGIRARKNIFDSVVLTTNGMNIIECADIVKGAVDIVNVSVHHYEQEERVNAFGLEKTTDLISDARYREINRTLKASGIRTSAVAVLYKPLSEPFEQFVKKFTEWARNAGFSDLRIRSDFYTKDRFFVRYINSDAFEGVPHVTAGLTTRHFECDGFPVTMFMGVESLIPYVVGVEAVVDDDGLPYLDYGKRFPFREDYVRHVYVSFP